jgi:hypothetical protein
MCADACCSAVLAGRAAHGSAAIARTIATRRACGARTSTIYALLWSEGSHRTCESGFLGALHIAFVFEHLFYSMCGRKARRPEESATVNHQSGDALATSDLTVAALKYGFSRYEDVSERTALQPRVLRGCTFIYDRRPPIGAVYIYSEKRPLVPSRLVET